MAGRGARLAPPGGGIEPAASRGLALGSFKATAFYRLLPYSVLFKRISGLGIAPRSDIERARG